MKLKEKGLHSTSRKYNIDRKPLRRWVNNKEKLKKVVNKKRRKNLNGGDRKPYTIDIEEQLIEFIKIYREIEIAISTHELIIEAIKLLPTLANNTYNANIMWAHRILKLNGFTIRNIIHTGQQIKAESKKFTEDFFKIVFNTRLNIYINDNINHIGNMDECAIYYENIYPTIIAKIGERSVKVRSFGK